MVGGTLFLSRGQFSSWSAAVNCSCLTCQQQVGWRRQHERLSPADDVVEVMNAAVDAAEWPAVTVNHRWRRHQFTWCHHFMLSCSNDVIHAWTQPHNQVWSYGLPFSPLLCYWCCLCMIHGVCHHTKRVCNTTRNSLYSVNSRQLDDIFVLWASSRMKS